MSTDTFGPAYYAPFDHDRILYQMEHIGAVMAQAAKADRWLTLADIEAATGYSQASIPAQIRHLGKKKFGGHIVDKRWRDTERGGTWEYIVPTPVSPSWDAVWGAEAEL